MKNINKKPGAGYRAYITATSVPDEMRLSFLGRYFEPHHFGSDLMYRLENLVYAMLLTLAKDYRGASWNCYSLSNGGFYLAPALVGKLSLCNPRNGFEATVSADAAGVITTLLALKRIMEEAVASGMQVKALALRFQELRAFAREHFEAASILRAVD